MMSAGEINFSGCRANAECKTVLEKIETACHAKPAQEAQCKNRYMDATGMPRTPDAEWKAMGLDGAQFFNWQGFLNSGGTSFHGQTLAAPQPVADATPAPVPAASASASASVQPPPPAAAPAASESSSSSAVAPLMIHASGSYTSGSLEFDSAFSGAQFGTGATDPQKIGSWGLGFQAGYLIPAHRQFSIGPTVGYAYSALQPIKHEGRSFEEAPNGGLHQFSLGVLGGYSPVNMFMMTAGLNVSLGWGHVMAGFAGNADNTTLIGVGGNLGAYLLPSRNFAVGFELGYDRLFTGNQKLDSELADNKSNNGSGGLLRVGLGIMGFFDVKSSEKK